MMKKFEKMFIFISMIRSQCNNIKDDMCNSCNIFVSGRKQDIWRGSCLLGTDVGAALVLLRRNVLGQKLTNREQKILKRTLTDLASVVPIGILMLLPVSC